jgi:hypothetical protein
MTPPTKDGNISDSGSSSADSNQTLLSKLLPWLVLLLTTLGLFYFVQRGCGSEPGINQMPHEMTQDTIK